MTLFFAKLLPLSLGGSVVALGVMVLRPLLKRTPRWCTLLLWALLALRLLFPFSLKSPWSIVPSFEESPHKTSTLSAPSPSPFSPENLNGIPEFTQDAPAVPTAGETNSPLSLTGILWLSGVAGMGCYTLFSFLSLWHRLREGVLFKGNIWLCDRIGSPFLLGLFHTRIYLPSAIAKEDIPYVVAHERAHLERGDHLWKLLAFALLSLHWFNPVLWGAYLLFCRDLEFFCDQRVLDKLGEGHKRGYCQALIRCSLPQGRTVPCALAFGEGSLKSRLKRALHYQKPPLRWGILGAALCLLAALLLFPAQQRKEQGKSGPVSSLGEQYVFSSSRDTASLTLFPDTGEFTFSPSFLSSALYTGRYQEREDTLTLETMEGNRYRFLRQGDGFVFQAEGSEPMPEFQYEPGTALSAAVPDGGLFVPETSAPYMDQALLDVDGDGRKEDCYLCRGPTSGVFTFALAALEEGKVEYFNIYSCDFSTFSFAENRETPTVQAVSPNGSISFFTIACQGKDLLLMQGGRSFPLWGNAEDQGVDSPHLSYCLRR